MNDSKIPVRYSKALFQSAKEEKIEAKVLTDMEFLKSSLSEPGFRQFLESPIIKTSQKKKLAGEVFGKYLHPLSMNFFYLILTNKRELYLDSIIRDYVDIYRDEHGIKNAVLKTPFKVSDAMKKQFISLLENTLQSKIEMEEIIDPDMIGGFILKVEDEQFDASVKTSLARIKKKLIETI